MSVYQLYDFMACLWYKIDYDSILYKVSTKEPVDKQQIHDHKHHWICMCNFSMPLDFAFSCQRIFL
jgi:hypothetical protein